MGGGAVTGVREPAVGRPAAGSFRPTLRFLGPVDGRDPAGPYAIRTGQVLRLLTRQLFAYPVAPAAGAAGHRPVPDVAAEMPTAANGGIGDGGRTYRIRLRAGVRWSAQLVRGVVAGDFVRGLKRTAHPAAAAVRPALAAVVEGMAEYYAAYDEAFPDGVPHAPALAQFIRFNQIEGVRAESDTVLALRLREPANDLVDILATGYTAAAGREYDYHLPDSPELHGSVPSAGPYRLARRIRAGGDLVLEPNPVWDPATDPVRTRPATRIDIVRDAAGASLDPAWSFGVASWSAAGSPPVTYGVSLSPYLTFHPAAGRPSVHLAVRRAVACAVDRAAVAAAVVAAGARHATAQFGLLPPGNPGAGDRPHWLDVPESGDPGYARRLLAEAGWAEGVRLVVATPPGGQCAPVLAALMASLTRANITLVPAVDGPADLTMAEWSPRWAGNTGRDLLDRLSCPNGVPASRGGLRVEAVDLARRALREGDSRTAGELWRRFDVAAMDDAWVVPVAAAAWPRTVADSVASGSARWRGA
jgi:peptide/nickel transport system substrate-binding protein